MMMSSSRSTSCSSFFLSRSTNERGGTWRDLSSSIDLQQQEAVSNNNSSCAGSGFQQLLLDDPLEPCDSFNIFTDDSFLNDLTNSNNSHPPPVAEARDDDADKNNDRGSSPPVTTNHRPPRLENDGIVPDIHQPYGSSLTVLPPPSLESESGKKRHDPTDERSTIIESSFVRSAPRLLLCGSFSSSSASRNKKIPTPTSTNYTMCAKVGTTIRRVPLERTRSDSTPIRSNAQSGKLLATRTIPAGKGHEHYHRPKRRDNNGDSGRRSRSSSSLSASSRADPCTSQHHDHHQRPTPTSKLLRPLAYHPISPPSSTSKKKPMPPSPPSPQKRDVMETTQQQATTTFNTTPTKVSPASSSSSPRRYQQPRVQPFFFREDSTGHGFELTPPRDKEYNLENARISPTSTAESNSSSSTLDFSVGRKYNATDEEMMLQTGNSPGAIRLTAEGLKLHELKVFTQNKRGPPSPIGKKKSPVDNIQKWKRERDRQTWLRKRQEAKLDDPIHQSAARATTAENTKPTTAVPTNKAVVMQLLPRVFPVLFKTDSSQDMPSSQGTASMEDDELSIADLSLAPLAHLGSLYRIDSPDRRQPRMHDAGRSGKGMRLFGPRKNCASERAQEILDKERQWARETKQRQEQLRIDAKRQSYLRPQRRSQSSLAAVKEEDDHLGPALVSPTASDAAAVATLPPCVLCKKGMRTHIATPCMHFSFCQACVTGTGRPTACPVCHKSKVHFASVSV